MCDHCGCRQVAPIADPMDQHRDLDAALEGLDAHSPHFADRVTDLLHTLDLHVERENLGIFPVSVVTLGADGWDTIDRAHTAIPTFLGRRPT